MLADPPNITHTGFPLVGTSILLYPNNTDPLLQNINVRKRLSYAINREKVVQIRHAQLHKAAPVTGLSPAYGTWEPPKEDWTRFDLQTIKRSTSRSKSSHIQEDGNLLDPQGNPVSLTISVVSGWSDWVRAAQVIAQQLSNWVSKPESKVEILEHGFPHSKRRVSALSGLVYRRTYSTIILWRSHVCTKIKAHRRNRGSKLAPLCRSTNRYHSSKHLNKPPTQKAIILSKTAESICQNAPAIPLFLNPELGRVQYKEICWMAR